MLADLFPKIMFGYEYKFMKMLTVQAFSSCYFFSLGSLKPWASKQNNWMFLFAARGAVTNSAERFMSPVRLCSCSFAHSAT
jgi:hypothetical protein